MIMSYDYQKSYEPDFSWDQKNRVLYNLFLLLEHIHFNTPYFLCYPKNHYLHISNNVSCLPRSELLLINNIHELMIFLKNKLLLR